MEERILAYWRENGIVEKSLTHRQGAEEWVFYEGPPTANNEPGVHHVEPRTFKDIFPRFHAMRGRYVHRKGGWDCHGLPVEVEVEKELGLESKRQIEEYGIERFVEQCRQSVRRYVEDFERLTERIAFWINMDEAYWTMDSYYIESVWWSLKRLYEEGLLFEDYRSSPYCPRCETGLSDHELGQPDVYQTVADPSVFVRFPLEDEHADLLIWTTTPWTLPSNLAAAVHPDVTYVEVETDGRPVIIAEPLMTAVMGEDARVIERLSAESLVGKRYRPPFRFVEPDKPAWFVIAEDFVTISDGTGIVHIAPAFGAEDLEAGKRHGLPFVNFVDRSGIFVADAPPFAGLPVKEADPKIATDLRERGLLFREEIYEHNYPHCWRCKTPLLYYAQSSWYVRTTARKDDLLAENEKTNWYPETIKQGRYGEWLRNNVDWALSRERYWGTPLPIWRCPEGHDTVAGSLSELSELAGRDLKDLDPHRPFVDEVVLSCHSCGQESRRVPSVIDAWYDSGAMPFAQWGYPYRGGEEFEKRFPADFIAEALDQTRGWFYSLMAVSTLLFDQNSYRNVLCLGLLVDEKGRKMSKSLRNVINPWTIIDAHGSDALRWWMFTSGSPWANRRIGLPAIEELVKRYFLTLWNTYSFFVTYANIDDYDPREHEPVAPENRPEIDRWILGELHDCVRDVTDALENYDALAGGRRLDAFVDVLSNWYVRRTRRRFWEAGHPDKEGAYQTLYECLVTLAKLSAPYTPFIAEEIFTNLTGSESVHLEDWPLCDASLIDADLIARMQTALKVVSLGRAARSEGKVKTRQPLPKALVTVPASEREGLSLLQDLIESELNVKDIELTESLDEFVDYSLKPNYRTLGPRLGAQVTALADALSSANVDEVRSLLQSEGSATFSVGGQDITLSEQDVEIRAEEKEGFAVAHEGAYGVALDLSITPELRLEGMARELVRSVNEARKEAGLDISDRVDLYIEAVGGAAEALEAHRDWIASEVLAASYLEDPQGAEFTREVAVDGEIIKIGIRKR